MQEFRNINCEVIGVSTDSHFTHLAWINTPRKEGGLGNIEYPLLADKSHAIARAYGVLQEESGISFRGLFIIDGKQNLRQMTVNDLPVGRSVDETLRLVQAFQYTDEHGEVRWLKLDRIYRNNFLAVSLKGLPSELEPKEQQQDHGSRSNSLKGLLQERQLISCDERRHPNVWSTISLNESSF